MLMRRNFADIAFSQVHDPIGNAGDSHRIRSAKHLIFADADNKRRTLTSEDNLMRLIAADDRERIASAQLQNCLFNRRQKIALIVGVNQVRNYFCIGLTREFVSLILKPRTNGLVILDDAVMHQPDEIM